MSNEIFTLVADGNSPVEQSWDSINATEYVKDGINSYLLDGTTTISYMSIEDDLLEIFLDGHEYGSRATFDIQIETSQPATETNLAICASTDYLKTVPLSNNKTLFNEIFTNRIPLIVASEILSYSYIVKIGNDNGNLQISPAGRTAVTLNGQGGTPVINFDTKISIEILTDFGYSAPSKIFITPEGGTKFEVATVNFLYSTEELADGAAFLGKIYTDGKVNVFSASMVTRFRDSSIYTNEELVAPSASGKTTRYEIINPNKVYRGWAALGSVDNSPVWYIEMYTKTNGVWTVHQADGIETFTKVWNDRTTYTYS
jgi:hypothetical protein